MCTPKAEASLHRGLGLTFTTITFLVSLAIFSYFNPKSSDGFQLVFDAEWIPGLGAHFKTGVDGISRVPRHPDDVPDAAHAARHAAARSTKHVREFIAAMLVLEAGMLGAFVALDLFLFYVCGR